MWCKLVVCYQPFRTASWSNQQPMPRNIPKQQRPGYKIKLLQLSLLLSRAFCKIFVWIWTLFELSWLIIGLSLQWSVPSQTSSCEVCDRQSGNGTGFSPNTLVSLSLSFNYTQHSSLIHHQCSTILATSFTQILLLEKSEVRILLI